MIRSILFRQLVLLLLWLVATSINAQDQPQPCNVCVGGAINEDNFFGSLSCSDWFDGASSAAEGDEACYLHRSAGVQSCGCGDDLDEASEGVFDTCYLCGDASSNQQANGNKVIPDSPGGLTCADILEMPIVDPTHTCPLLQEKYQRWCECPSAINQEPACTFCPNGGEPDVTITYPFDNLPTGVADCSVQQDYYEVQTAEACPLVQASDRDYFLIDMPAYCQCPSTEPPKVCPQVFCPSGTGIPSDRLQLVVDDNDFGITCADSSFMLEMITNPDNCQVMLGYAPECCATTAGVFVADPQQSSSTTMVTTGGMAISVAIAIVAFAAPIA